MLLIAPIALLFAAAIVPRDLQGVSMSQKISEHGRMLLAANVTFATHQEKTGNKFSSPAVTVADCYNAYYTYYVSFACPSTATVG